MENKQTLLEEDIVALLDHFMTKGGGHMNIDVNQIQSARQIREAKFSECNTKAMACQIPTLHEGIDQEQE